MSEKEIIPESIPAEEIQCCLKVLEELGRDPALLAGIRDDIRVALMKAAGTIAHPTRDDRRIRVRASRKLKQRKRKDHDRTVRNQAPIRQARRSPVFEAPRQITSMEPPEGPHFKTPQKCYVCKARYTQLHSFYDSMCPSCGDLNYRKRFQSADLTGRTALVTGGRVKIGFQTALKLLRAGARTVVTTRFPQDAALRFSREDDFQDWKDRLQIHGLDLRHSPSVEMFARFLLQTETRLDALVNNAAQTVRKPPGFYRHLMEWEARPVEDLPAELRPLLAAREQCRREISSAPLTGDVGRLENTVLKTWPGKSAAVGLTASAKLSMIPYDFDEDVQAGMEVFPDGRLDADMQQVDLRQVNSWRLALVEVSTPEMLEVHLVNAVAPFILAARLKPLMLRTPAKEKHIINASAMEGKFSRFIKTDKHPHTNMAKAALNMLTWTSASDYARDGIYMNAVDTGWITDEDPAHIGSAKKDMHDFEPPLDIVDGAARLLDPLFDHLLTCTPMWGQFLKDYSSTAW